MRAAMGSGTLLHVHSKPVRAPGDGLYPNRGLRRADGIDMVAACTVAPSERWQASRGTSCDGPCHVATSRSVVLQTNGLKTQRPQPAHPQPVACSTAHRTARPFAAMAGKRKVEEAVSYARLDAWARGAIWGMSLMGAPLDRICESVTKTAGTVPSIRAVTGVIARKKEEPQWRGEEEHSGRPRTLTDEQQQQVVDLVFAERGKAKVTVSFCKKKLRFLTQAGNSDRDYFHFY